MHLKDGLIDLTSCNVCPLLPIKSTKNETIFSSRKYCTTQNNSDCINNRSFTFGNFMCELHQSTLRTISYDFKAFVYQDMLNVKEKDGSQTWIVS